MRRKTPFLEKLSINKLSHSSRTGLTGFHFDYGNYIIAIASVCEQDILYIITVTQKFPDIVHGDTRLGTKVLRPAPAIGW